jgi:hypothetical protein
MGTPSKTPAVALITLQSVASNAVVVGTAVDVSTKLAAFIGIHIGRRATTALTTAAVIRIEASTKASGDGYWFTLFSVASDTVACENEPVSGTVSAGTAVVTVASTTNLTAGDLVYIDNGTIANSEWGRVKAISANVSITLEDALRNAQTSSQIYDRAQIIGARVDLQAVTRIRAVVDASATGQAIAVEVDAVTFDSFG